MQLRHFLVSIRHAHFNRTDLTWIQPSIQAVAREHTESHMDVLLVE